VTACADKLLQSRLLLKEGSPHGRRLFRRPRVARMEKPFGEGTEDHAECQKLKIAGNRQKRSSLLDSRVLESRFGGLARGGQIKG
jgi:hypothetical protein